MKNYDRHFGCRLSEITHEGVRTLILENDIIRVSLLLDKGTDITSFLHKPSDTDFIWHAPWGMRNPAMQVPLSNRPEGTFFDVYEGGWTEVFPSAIAGSHLGAYFGDMGEVSLLPWDFQVIDDSPERLMVKLSVNLVRYPLHVEKCLTIEKGNAVLKFFEEITNLSEVALDFMWGQHPTFGAPFLDENCVVDVPECNAYTQRYGEYPRLQEGGPQKWPYAKGIDGNMVDLSCILSPKSRTEDMMYLADMKDSWYAITNTAKQVGFGMHWDMSTFPYLWYWQCFSGPNPQPFFGRAYALGIEPWTSPPVRLEQAVQDQTSRKIGSYQTIQTSFVAVAYQGIQRVQHINEYGEIQRK